MIGCATTGCRACAAGAEQAHRPGGRVDQHAVVVAVEHHHADPQRVEALAAEPGLRIVPVDR